MDNSAINISGEWRLLGLDIGGKKVGLSTVSSDASVVLPIGMITGRDMLQQIHQLIIRRAITAVVAGMPLEMNGNIGNQATAVQKFIDKLASITDVPIYSYDERLSSKMANRMLQELDFNRQKRQQFDDQLAATLILQGFCQQQRLL